MHMFSTKRHFTYMFLPEFVYSLQLVDDLSNICHASSSYNYSSYGNYVTIKGHMIEQSHTHGLKRDKYFCEMRPSTGEQF